MGAFTSERITPEDFAALRNDLLNNPRYIGLAPSFLKRIRDVAALWSFAKQVSPHWEPRRSFVRDEFKALLDHLERFTPVENIVAEALSKLDEAHVRPIWDKAIARCTFDPEGAVTSARTLLESTCRLILEAADATDVLSENPDLPKLYRRTAEYLNLGPSQHSEEAFKRILGGCTSVVEGLGTLRNKVGDAHGHGRGAVKPLPRHALLAVNLSGAMSMFLIETWEARTAAVAA
ncbi:abortive infection family protein [Novosphingobium sp. KCTC 2891]|uniref:abortive infection family protein n=1 Tax=Novosphingobium sp. KCTC 2891 TaxID=2989730 RepID=UPI002221CC5C|nr:abortive infection family protein [Novosphingobium sp. KCTC 2891]